MGDMHWSSGFRRGHQAWLSVPGSPGFVPVAMGSGVAEAVHVLVEGRGHAVGFQHAEEGVSTPAQ